MKRLCIALALVCLVALPLLAQSSGSWEIVRADYGSGNSWIDVTDRVRSLVEGDSLNFRVDANTLGADSRRGRNRALRLQIKDTRGSSRQITYRDSQQVNLRVYSAQQTQNNLHINRAVYGSGNRSLDVTSRLNSQIRGDQLNIRVSNQSMGGDPTPNQSKTLSVQYALNGRVNQVVVNEGDTLRLPFGNHGYNNNSNNNGYGNNGPGNGNNNGYGNNSGLAQRIVCESLQGNNYGRQYCPANTRGGVRLSRTIANSDCTQGSTWGYDNGGVWVDRGCRAEFITQENVRSAATGTSTTIPNGTELSVRTNEVIDSKTTSEGQTFSAMIAGDVLDNNGSIRVPKGSDARLVIRSVNGGGISSSSDLVLDVDSLTISGTKYMVSTGDLVKQGGQGVGANQKTAIMVGGGAAVGTLIGAILGGGKGAAIGAAVGAGAGLGTEVLTKGKQVRVPAETLLSFRLDQDLFLRAAR